MTRPDSMERLQFVGFHWGLILVEVSKWVLCTIVVRVVISIDGLRLQPRYGIELLDSRSTQARERTENRTFDLGDFRVLNSIDEGVLRFGSVILEFLRGVLFPKRCDFVKVHLQIVCHLLRQIVFWRGRSNR